MARLLASPILLSLAIALLGEGCYLSHERPFSVPARVDAGLSDGSPPLADAAVPTDAGPPIDAFVRPCTWSVVEPWQLTEPPGDQRLLDVAAVPSGFLVVTSSSNDPPPEPGRFVRRVGLRGPLAERAGLFTEGRGWSLGGVSLAVGSDRVVAATWDDAGCVVREMSLEGVPRGDVRGLPLRGCTGLHATADGFAIFDRPGDLPVSLHTLDAAGANVIATGPVLDVLDGAFWWARARLPDDATLLIGMRSGVEPTSAVAQRIDARGEPAGPMVELPSFAAASRVRAVATSRGALVGWLEQPEGIATSQERVLRAVAVDAEGSPTAEPIVASTGPAYRDAGLSLAAIEGGVLAAFVESDPGDRFGHATRVVVLRLSEAGTPIERFVIADAMFARTPVLRVLGHEALIAYTGSAGGIPTQVFVAGLECR